MFIITGQRNDGLQSSTSPTFCCTSVVPFVSLAKPMKKREKKCRKIKKPPKRRLDKQYN